MMSRKNLIRGASLSALLMAASPALAVPGWNVLIQDNFGEGGIGGTIDNMNEAEILLSLGGAPEASASAVASINYLGAGAGGSIGGDIAFPGGFGGTNDFALNATGYVTGIAGPGTGVFRLGVNSDDGFRVRRNGTVIGEFAGIRAPGDTLFNAQLTNGDKIEINYFERGGGEEVEFFQVLNSGRQLVGASSSLFQIDNAPTPAGTALDLGFKAEVYNAAGAGVFGDGDALVENINEAEALIALGGVDGMSQPLLLSGETFPGATPNDFAARYTGYVNILDGKSANVFLHVGSDDGFRLRVNGSIVSQFVGVTGNSNTISGLVTLNDGDFIELTMFERGGGQFINFTRDFDGLLGTSADRSFVGTTESGILITLTQPIPEPATALLGLAGAGALALRRRRA